jgi:2-polyprenyl-3-methyl-5-hydroxy-6-metoxy-1,4-benzoquinol methylase
VAALDESASDYRKMVFDNYSTFRAKDLATPEQQRRYRKACSYYLRGWLPDNRRARVVDVACGEGSLLAALRDFGYQDVSGIDISAEQVALARQVCPDVQMGDVLEFLAAHAGCFDFIAAMDIMEHLPKSMVMPFMARCFTALRPGGRLVVQVPNGDSPWAGALRYADLTHELSYSPALMEKLLKRQGFVDIELRPAGPVPWGYSWASALRAGLWQVFRGLCWFWTLVETGSGGPGVFTRVFLASARKG